MAVVTNHGGAVLDKVQVSNVFFGSDWVNTANAVDGKAASDQINAFSKYLVQSPYLDQLKEYNVGKGSFVKSDNFVPTPSDERSPYITDSTIQSALAAEVKLGNLAPTSESLFVVYTEANKEIFFGGGNSVGGPNGFVGYHDHFTDPQGHVINYAVVVNPAIVENTIHNFRLSGLATFQQQTVVSSHEIAEAVTDPHGDAWFDNSAFTHADGTTVDAPGDEIGDMTNTQFGQEGLYEVQYEWSNSRNAGYLAPDLVPPPPPAPPPPPTSTGYSGSSGSAGDPPVIFGGPVNHPPWWTGKKPTIN